MSMDNSESPTSTLRNERSRDPRSELFGERLPDRTETLEWYEVNLDKTCPPSRLVMEFESYVLRSPLSLLSYHYSLCHHGRKQAPGITRNALRAPFTNDLMSLTIDDVPIHALI